MSLRNYLEKLKKQGELVEVKKPISKDLDAAGFLKAVEPSPVLFHEIKETEIGVMGNLFCTKQSFADYLGIKVEDIIPRMIDAIDNRSQPNVIEMPACQEVVIQGGSLNLLPILKHCDKDGGNYLSSGIFIAEHPKWGQNVDFHRGMQINEKEMAIRVVKGRHFDKFLEDQGAVKVAICVGNPPHILAAAATSVDLGVNELEIANSLEPFEVAKAITCDAMIPAESEIVIEGTIYRDRLRSEGPFVDLTETYDFVRQQPVFELSCITHRKNPLWHALLPGALEHKLLMGMPREPTIFRKVKEVVRCLDVNVNPGGASWLHAIVQIDKQKEDDGKKAIQAAFEGHTSCKHVFVVDKDINIYEPLEVEWAMATRFQGDRDMVVYDKAPGSSLDPSAEPDTKQTTRVGFDLTAPLTLKVKQFRKAEFPTVEIQKYI